MLARDEIHVLKNDIVAVDIVNATARQQVSLLTRTMKVMFYTARFVFNVDFPAGSEARLGELLDGLKADFFGVVNAQVFSLRASRAQVPRTSEMLLLNRQHITHYHAG